MTRRQQQVQRIAERYRSKGFEVSVDPAPEVMPEHLAWLRADLVAQRGDEHVLVLVEGNIEQLQFLADVVSGIAGWRLDLHVLDDKDTSHPTGKPSTQ